jgi:hypothetical protein
MVSPPTVKPFAVVGGTPLKVAIPLLSAAEPTVTLPTLNVTVPVGVPLVVVTVAVKLCFAEELPRAMEDGLAVTDVVVFAVTASVAGLLVEPESLLSPAYSAVIESEPTVKPLVVVAARVSVAVLLESVPVPSVVLPFLNVTVPVATAGLTVAVIVTDAPSVTELGTDNIVVVASLFTVSSTVAVAVV